MAQKKSKSITVANVNDKQLFGTQLDIAVKDYNELLKEQGINVRSLGQDQLHKVRKFILQKMVERELLHQEAKKQKIKVTSSEIDELIQGIEKHYPSHQAFLDDISKDGQTIDTYKERLAYDMLVNKVAAKRYENRKKQPSNDEIHSFYLENRQLFAQPESVKIGHILLKVPEDADGKEWENARNKLCNLRKSKEDFRELAKIHSQCDSARDGGDLGFYMKGNLIPPLEIAALKLKENEISQPVESPQGLHLIKLYERKQEGFIPPFDEIKEQVEQAAKTDHAQNIYNEYVEELRERAKIEIFEN